MVVVEKRGVSPIRSTSARELRTHYYYDIQRHTIFHFNSTVGHQALFIVLWTVQEVVSLHTRDSKGKGKRTDK